MTHHPRILTSTDLAPDGEWKKSSYSSQDNGNCVETVRRPDLVGVRDSKDKGGLVLAFAPEAWGSFISLVVSGRADFGIVDA